MSKHSKWPFFLRMHGSVLPKMLLPLVVVAAWSTAITVISEMIYELKVSSLLLTVLGFVVGLAISFRTSSAYERYTEGRKYWTQLQMVSQNMARTIWIHTAERDGELGKEDLLAKVTALNLLVTFATAVKHKLRFEPGIDYADLRDRVEYLDTFAKAAEPDIPQQKEYSKMKALGEYLERERSSFPRFYFVGDEDLLEIIGNSKDILRIMKHLKKMFAGIATIQLDDDLTQIMGMSSREGEEIRFTEPILLKDYPKINDWLARLETMMRLSLANLLSDSVAELQGFYGPDYQLTAPQLMEWMEKYPAQLVTLAIQVAWTGLVESSLESGVAPESTLTVIHQALDLLADIVLQELSPVTRRKCEHLITELVHQRDVTRSLIQQRILDSKGFTWLYQMRFYLDKSVENPLDRLSIKTADATFPYGWEYLGVPDRLVQTPLTDRVYLTLTQALDNQLGGAPFGPAGTGKRASPAHKSCR